MRYLLRHVPIVRNEVVVRGRVIRVKWPQIIVWLSIDLRGGSKWQPGMPRFPAILDTGNTHSFFIRESHLLEWAGINTNAMREFGKIRVAGEFASQRLANLYMHRNIPGKRDESGDHAPFFLSMTKGIAVCPDNHPRAPRLPLLGLHSLIENKLILKVDGVRNEISLRTAPPQWWPF